MPYDPIANPLPDSGVDQRVRDSLTLKPSRIRLNQAGYRTQDVVGGMAKFYHVGSALAFTVIDSATGTVVGTGPLVAKGFNSGTNISVIASNWAGTVSGGDTRYRMSTTGLGTTILPDAVMEGTLPGVGLVEGGKYRIVVGKDTSHTFLVSDNVYGMVRDGVLKFFGIQRSGSFPSWFHRASHMKDGSLATPPAPGAYKGGWYDCGDHLKEPQTMSYALATLATLAATMPERDANHYGMNHANTLRTDGIPDILFEAYFGGRFFVDSWVRHGRSTGPRGGTDSGMVTGVGDFGKDHGWWGRPENQDAMTEVGRGGWKERILRSELGANTLGDVAAGLAILSKRWRPYDPKWADTALMAAKDMYAYAKANRVVVSSPAYNGAGPDKVNANLALAATALLWVTKDKSYLSDIAYDKTVGSHGATWNAGGGPTPMKSSWEGGWMVYSNPNLTKGGANSDWANRHQLALYAFYKLILSDKDSALAFGVRDEAERQNLVTHTIAGVVQNLNSISGGAGISIDLPSVDPNDGGGYAIRAGGNWFTMFTQQQWVWNRYQVANAFELFIYYDITRDLEAGLAGTELTGYAWNRGPVRQLMVRQMDYMLGVNPWDVSMFMGLGEKNFNHPHHRAANPEGRNTPGTPYAYHVPVGALYGAWDPTLAENGVVEDYWNEYHTTEVCLDGAASSIAIATGLAADVPLNLPPVPTVKVVYVSDTLAQIEIQLDKYGRVVLDYGLAPGTWIKSLPSDSPGVSHKYLIGGLKPATQYFFDVRATDLAGNSATYTKWENPLPDGTPFSFTTKALPVGPAQIENVKVCNVTADSAEIMWFTPDGEHQSSICWGRTPVEDATWTCADDIDESGHPTKFHYVKIGGLTEKTNYWFKVGSDGVWDNNQGLNYTFRTPVKMANFSMYAVQYDWAGMPALGINVVNNEARDYDSLSVRVYVRSPDTLKDATGTPLTHIKSTAAGLVDVPLLFEEAMAARYDICQAYDGAGFNKPCDDPVWGLDWSWGTLNRGVQMLRPMKMPETYDPVTNTTVFYFDLPLGPTMMKQGSRIRFDVMFAERSEYSKLLNAAQLDLINWVKVFVPTVPVFHVNDTGWFDVLDNGLAAHPMGKNTLDWSFMPHSTAAGDPVDFPGIPIVKNQTEANALIDNLSADMPLNPYMTVYRKGEFVYGFSPSHIEQATKKTYWGAEVKWAAPFDVPDGNTIVLDRASSTVRVKGVANIFDKLTPAAKGVVTDIWVNGTRLTPAQLAQAAIQDPVSKLWNLDIPVRMGVGGNSVDITIFGGSGVCPDTATTCENGCAFDNGSWFVQFTKGNSTTSSIAFLDPASLGVLSGDLVPDSSSVVVEVRDNDNNLTRAGKDLVKVILRSGTDSVALTLTETGDSTGVFRSAPVSISTLPGWTAGSISPVADSLQAIYRDANDPEDSAQVRLRVRSAWPTPLRGGIFRACDGSYEARVLFDRAFPGGAALGPELVVDGGFEDASITGKGLQFDGTSTFRAWRVADVDIIDDSILPPASGGAALDLNNAKPGAIGQKLATTPGQRLVLGFEHSWNSWTGDTKGTLAVVLWNGVVVDTIRRPVGARRWEHQTVDLVAIGNDSLVFKSISGDAYGIMIDDVSLRAVSTGTVVGLGPDTVTLRSVGGASQVIPLPGAATSLDAAGTTLIMPLAGVPEIGNRTGSASMMVPDGRGGYKAVSQALSDSVGPWIDSARIVENLTGGVVDTIALWVSEPISVPAKTWFTEVVRSGSPLATSGIVVDSAWLSDPVTGRWTVVVRTGVLKAGDQVRLGGSAQDLAGNGASPCPELRDLKLWVRQAPVSRAWIRDADGDGTADQVVVVYKRNLRAGETPERAVVRFGVADSVRDVVVAPVVGDSQVAIDLPAYSRSLTMGSGSQGMGSITLFKNGDSARVPLIDSVGPALLSAKLTYGSGATDTLLLSFSEPTRSIVGTSWLQIPVAGTSPLTVVGNPIAVDDWNWKILVDTGSILPGDSTRPTPGGRFVDANGRSAAPLHPWVEIQGEDRPPAMAWYSDVDGDGAVDRVTMVWSRAPRTRPSFVLLWPSLGGGYDTVRVASNGWIMQPDGKTTVVSIGPFDLGVTSSSTTDLGRQVSGTASVRFPIHDSVPPVLLSAKLSYEVGQHLPPADTLHLVFSEQVTLDKGVSGLFLGTGGAPASIAFIAPGLSGDGIRWAIPVDTVSVFPGDSVKPENLTGFVDALENRPTVSHPWVKVQGSERAPQAGWAQDLDGDGAVDHLLVRWGHRPRTRPALDLLWPNRAGTLDSVRIVADSWELQPDGLSALLPVGPFEVGATSASRLDLGRQISAGTTTGFPVHDQVAPVLMTARLGYAQEDGAPDTLHVSWSEVISWTGVDPLLVLDAGASGIGPVRARQTLLRSDSLGAMLLLDSKDSTLSVLRAGDRLRLSPTSSGTVTDRLGNSVEDPTRWVPVVLGRRPPRFKISFEPNKLKYEGWPLPAESAPQVWVRAAGAKSWNDFTTGNPVDPIAEAQGLGPTILLNQPLRGKAIIYDNQGTFVGGVELDLLGEAFYTDRIPKDRDNQYEVRIQWRGMAANGTPGASGVYMLRLVLWQNLAGEDENPEYSVFNKVYPFGWEVSTK
ncbi:MAG: glycoside hydrolase family 9 protein [Fibrobacteria bacterium]|nr:glycoside hydrolase family 9 protein [Fibrobacteria bacterium]